MVHATTQHTWSMNLVSTAKKSDDRQSINQPRYLDRGHPALGGSHLPVFQRPFSDPKLWGLSLRSSWDNKNQRGDGN